MNKFTTKAVYKSKAPEETIDNIKGILKSCNINTTEKYLHQSVSDTHAAEVRLYDKAIGDLRVASNGKGMTKQYALASAYAEFMERLECGGMLFEFRDEAYKRGDIRYRWSQDETEVDAEECIKDCGSVLRSFFGFNEKDFEDFCEKLKGRKLSCIPFMDVLNNRQVLLPYYHIFRFSSTNGMCAGNDSREAIAQGISELYERDALMRIYRDNPEMPVIQKESFSDTEIRKHLELLEEKGYAVYIVDCSMGLNYPVIGLRVIGDEGLYFTLGADPNPVVALERCLTEMFQLTDESKIKKRATKDSCGTRKGCKNVFEKAFYNYQLARSRHVNSGEKPDNIHNLSDRITTGYCWDEEENPYDYLVELTRKLGYHLYISDCSYLGFPAYIVFIPEISLGNYVEDGMTDDIIKGFIGDMQFKREEYYDAILPLLREIENRYV